MSDTNNEILDEEFIEESQPKQRIYSVILDENGYYTGMACIANYSRFEGGVDVETLPPADDSIMKLAYQLIEGMWFFDEVRYEQLLEEEKKRQEEEANRPIEPTLEEQIEQLKAENEVLTATVDSVLTEVIPEIVMMLSSGLL